MHNHGPTYSWPAGKLTRKKLRLESVLAMIVCGYVEERALLVPITIGLAHQAHLTWVYAAEWSESAFARAHANQEWALKYRIVKALQIR